VTVELDESTVDLILSKGFSPEYGARNLERVMDRLLGTLVADALLSRKIFAGQTIRLEAVAGEFQLSQCSAL
jgi:ATP-dependent Clp protease ATP-binding subunit ClpC